MNYNPPNFSAEDMEPLVGLFEQKVIQRSKSDDEAEREVVGGALFQFTTQIQALLENLVEQFKVKDKGEWSCSEFKNSWNSKKLNTTMRQQLDLLPVKFWKRTHGTVHKMWR